MIVIGFFQTEIYQSADMVVGTEFIKISSVSNH